MKHFSAKDLENWSGGIWNRLPGGQLAFFSNDTRNLSDGDIFVALKTSRRDGHDFLQAAKDAGAVAALVSEYRQEVDLPQLKVPDVLRGFQQIARSYRVLFNGPVIGVTGSCGKTTCKDLLTLLLGGGDSILSTAGNLNNFLGVPLTLMRGDLQRHRYSVVEAGISEKGEMETLAEMIDPDVALITSIGPAHLEGLENVETVASEKLKLGQQPRTKRIYLDTTAAAYISEVAGRDVSVARLDENLQSIGSYRVRSKGASTLLDLRLQEGVCTFTLAHKSKSFASNVSLSLLVASSFGVEPEVLAERLATWKQSGMRGEWLEVGDKRVYLDCYNANPLSMTDSLGAFIDESSPDSSRLFIIGCMEELGVDAPAWHERLGQTLELHAEDQVCIVGQNSEDVLRGIKTNPSKCASAVAVQSMQTLKTTVNHFSGDVFIKGSRRYQLENALDDALENLRKEIS